MKRIILLFCFLSSTTYALDRPQLDKMLTTAATATGESYLEARQAILDHGKDSLPLLLQAAVDSKLTWQQRLVARISYEKITRGVDIEALRRYDWRKDPRYDKEWERPILGPKTHLGMIVIPKCAQDGLWYYYIEMAWKNTGEYAVWAFDPRINDTRTLSESWLGWCIAALQGIGDSLTEFPAYRDLSRLNVQRQPERYYLAQALIERLEQDSELSEPIDVEYYQYLLLNKETNAVPVLVKRLEPYVKLSRPKDLSRQEIDGAIGWEFKKVLSFADSRHFDFFDKFISEHPALAPLKDKVAPICARPAPPNSVEPPFRLGQQLAKP